MPDVVQRRFIKRFFFILFLSPFKREGRRGRRGGGEGEQERIGDEEWKEGVAPNCSVHGRTEPAGDGVCQEANEYWFASHVFRVDGPMVCI